MAACRERPDAFVGVAAVADWHVVNPSVQKIKKTGKGDVPTLSFAQNPDILASVAALDDPPYCVGFAAESDDLLSNGQAKRQRKNIPLLVANIGPDTFGADDNQLLIIDANGHRQTPRLSKRELAAELAGEIADRLAAAATAGPTGPSGQTRTTHQAATTRTTQRAKPVRGRQT